MGRSHFIIWRDNILLFGYAHEETGSPRGLEETEALAHTVLARLPPTGFVSFVEVADALGEVRKAAVRTTSTCRCCSGSGSAQSRSLSSSCISRTISVRPCGAGTVVLELFRNPD